MIYWNQAAAEQHSVHHCPAALPCPISIISATLHSSNKKNQKFKHFFSGRPVDCLVSDYICFVIGAVLMHPIFSLPLIHLGTTAGEL